ncbi:hypothetical protein D3C85_1546030 [compost metagenome]
MDKLGCGKVSCSTNFSGMNDNCISSFNGFRERELINVFFSFGPTDFGPERQQFIITADHCGTINSSQPGKMLYFPLKCRLPENLTGFFPVLLKKFG